MLDDKYTLESGYAFMTGIQALVRLPMVQRRRDFAAGCNTAGFVTGYRGSPLGVLDQQMKRAQGLLEEHHVKFHTGINEDLAATSLWGTQQSNLHGEGKYDGVFSMWYGKGPGVDRSGDVLRHGNLAGTMPLGGVLALLGDDHTCESSTTCQWKPFTGAPPCFSAMISNDPAVIGIKNIIESMANRLRAAEARKLTAGTNAKLSA